MSDGVKVEADFSGLLRAFKAFEPEVAKETGKELKAIAVELRDRVRTKVPSNMPKSKVRAGFTGTKGAYVAANPPVGSYDGARVKPIFIHPVFPQAGSPRSSWNWATQPTNPILEDTFDELRGPLQAATDAALQRAWDKVGGGS